MVNFLSMFCPEFQILLKPIYNLTRKSRPFAWGKEQQDSFEKSNIGKLSIEFYTCPIQLVDFIDILTPVNLLLEVCYTKYRMANPSLLHMPVKDLPEAARNYSTTELEPC